MHSHLPASINSQCSVILRESCFFIWAVTAESTAWKPLYSIADVHSENTTIYVRKIFTLSDCCITEKDSQPLSISDFILIMVCLVFNKKVNILWKE